MVNHRIYIPLLAVVLLIASQGICSAEWDKPAQFRWKQMEFQAKISYISPESDFILASERPVNIVDMRHGRQRYRTHILDALGNTMQYSDLKKGQWIYVRGGHLPDGTIGARSIFLIPRQLDEKDIQRLPGTEVLISLGGIKRSESGNHRIILRVSFVLC